MSGGGRRRGGELLLQFLGVGDGRPLVLRLAQSHLVHRRTLTQELGERERERERITHRRLICNVGANTHIMVQI